MFFKALAGLDRAQCDGALFLCASFTVDGLYPEERKNVETNGVFSIEELISSAYKQMIKYYQRSCVNVPANTNGTLKYYITKVLFMVFK